jgi:2,4-dienoyl-CoA reductase-like NADH-dependent reductase (Old Yellow Enzyme family)
MARSLFEPTMINNMSLNNRLVRSATYESMSAEDGSVTDPLIELYTTLAKGGVGLIITGYAYVQENGHGMPFQTGVFRDDNIPGLAFVEDFLWCTSPMRPWKERTRPTSCHDAA